MNFKYKFPPEVIHNRNFHLKIFQIKISLEIMLVSPERTKLEVGIQGIVAKGNV